jgi:hypothetical protein
MSHTQISAILNFPILVPDSGKNLYKLKTRISDFYGKIKDYDFSTMTESNIAELDGLFSELYGLVHMNVNEDSYNAVFRDSVICSLLPAIHRSYSSFFSVHETYLAREVLANADPWKMLESFPLYQRYVNLIRVQVQNSPEIKTLAFIGCGPLPVTLLLFSKIYGIRCTGIDKDPEAVELARKCVKHFGLEKEISIVLGDETALSKIECDSVLIAGLAEPKKSIFRNLHSFTKNKKQEPKQSISICYRNYTGMRQLLYKPVLPEDIRGFRKVKEILPSGGVNNTLVFLERE